jgi:hypothetical protein
MARHNDEPDAERRALRRLFEAASETEPPTEPPPFFAARVRARAAATAAPARHPIGAAAWRLLPLLCAVALAVSGWTGYESYRYAAERDRALARIFVEGGGGDLIVAALLLGGEQ